MTISSTLPTHLVHLQTKSQTVRELSRKTPDSLGAKLLTA